jgi:hypothetical protein
MTDDGRNPHAEADTRPTVGFSGYTGGAMPGWTLGDVIRRHRKAKGPRWTQTYLGEQCRPRLNKDQVVRAENNRPVELDTLQRIATALGTTIEALRSEVTSSTGVKSPTVDRRGRTLYTAVKPLGVEAISTGEETEKAMRDDPDLRALLDHWGRMDFDQRGELLLVARKLTRRAQPPEAPGKALG